MCRGEPGLPPPWKGPQGLSPRPGGGHPAAPSSKRARPTGGQAQRQGGGKSIIFRSGAETGTGRRRLETGRGDQSACPFTGPEGCLVNQPAQQNSVLAAPVSPMAVRPQELAGNRVTPHANWVQTYSQGRCPRFTQRAGPGSVDGEESRQEEWGRRQARCRPLVSARPALGGCVQASLATQRGRSFPRLQSSLAQWGQPWGRCGCGSHGAAHRPCPGLPQTVTAVPQGGDAAMGAAGPWTGVSFNPAFMPSSVHLLPRTPQRLGLCALHTCHLQNSKTPVPVLEVGGCVPAPSLGSRLVEPQVEGSGDFHSCARPRSRREPVLHPLSFPLAACLPPAASHRGRRPGLGPGCTLV